MVTKTSGALVFIEAWELTSLRVCMALSVWTESNLTVRSLDLDTWSNEQVEPLVKWGNKRANLYWEAKLPPNYTPDDSKIENFIRTKYDLKRWTLSPTIPDPATLGDSSATAANAEDAVVSAPWMTTLYTNVIASFSGQTTAY